MRLPITQKRTIALRWCLGIALFCVCVVLFYRQAVGYGGLYPSDLRVHMEFASSGRGYSILYWLLGLLISIARDQALITAAFEASLVVASWFIGSRYIFHFFSMKRLSSDLLSAALIFLGTCYLPVGGLGFYLGALVTQPWHNITFFGMRLLSLLCMWTFMDKLLDSSPDALTLREWATLTVLLALCTSVKPNFLLTFGLALAVHIIVRYVMRIQLGHDVLRATKDALAMGSVVVPSLIILWVQSRILYASPSTGVEASGVAVRIMDSRFFANGPVVTIVKMLKALAFPAIVIWVNRRDLRTSDLFNYLHFAVALAMTIALCETGPRESHGNFYWGLYNAAYLLFLWCVPQFVQSCRRLYFDLGRFDATHTVGIALLVWHCASGLAYFVILCRGASFGI